MRNAVTYTSKTIAGLTHEHRLVKGSSNVSFYMNQTTL